jgi:hypothetical protein
VSGRRRRLVRPGLRTIGTRFGLKAFLLHRTLTTRRIGLELFGTSLKLWGFLLATGLRLRCGRLAGLKGLPVR